MERRRLLLSLLVIAALALMSCGGDGSEGDVSGNGATSVTITGSEFAYDPATVAVAADTDVTVTFENAGSIDHNWTVLVAGTEVTAEDEIAGAPVVASIGDTNAGASDTTTLSLSSGTYQVVCTIVGHFAAGMTGTLEVGGG